MLGRYGAHELAILELLASHDIVECRSELLDAAVRLHVRLHRGAPERGDSLEKGFLAIALRAIETRILADPEMRKIATYWDSLFAVADELIENRLRELTGVEQVPPSLVRYIRTCLSSDGSRKGEKSRIGLDLFEKVVEASLSPSSSFEPRCFWCGYHFRPQDIGPDRAQILADFGALLADSIHPGRLEDDFKPWQILSGTRARSLTGMTVDHRTPEAGFGATEVENLVLACEFCNSGRMVYRRAFEPLSAIIAGSLQGCPSGRQHSLLRQIGVVAAIVCSRRRCESCEYTSEFRELSIDIDDEHSGVRWITPWSVRVRCYHCIEGDLRNEVSGGP